MGQPLAMFSCRACSAKGSPSMIKRLLHLCKALADLRKIVPLREMLPVSWGIVRACLCGNRGLNAEDPPPEWLSGFLGSMDGRCGEVVIGCKEGTLDDQGCRITVRDRNLAAHLFRTLNNLYEKEPDARLAVDHGEDDPWDDVEPGVWYSVATCLYEFDVYRDGDGLVQFAVEASLNPDGSRTGILSLGRDVYSEEDRYFGKGKKIAEDELDALLEEVKRKMKEPPNESEFLNWKDVYPHLDD